MFDEKAIAEQFKAQIMTAENENNIAMLIQQAFAFLKMNDAITPEVLKDIVSKVETALSDMNVDGNAQAEKNKQKAIETINTLKVQL
ncbi:hypothetical protein V6R21_08310 [Limibacter armeniacum]|uniref:hypothetical protein n=1 Tax=Limibacter armeniacum TaxID=466084 RepID=UPI002FE5222F